MAATSKDHESTRGTVVHILDDTPANRAGRLAGIKVIRTMYKEIGGALGATEEQRLAVRTAALSVARAARDRVLMNGSRKT